MKKYILWLGLALSSGVFSSCEKFLDQNTDPNNPSTATPNFLLPGIISQGIQTQMFTALTTVYTTQYLVRRSPVGSTDQFNFTNANSTNTFNYTYYYSAGNINPMIKEAQNEGSPYYVGAGKVMMALVLSHATDMLGDIPYTEAFLGAQNYTPKYDSQEQIYATVNQLLDEAVVELSKPAAENFRPLYTTVPAVSGDILYLGDVQKWIRLAYSLKARQLNHLSKKGSYKPEEVLALVDKGFKSSQDDAQLNYQVAVAPLTGTTNIFGTTRNNFATATFSANFLKYLNGNTFAGGVVDPRLPVMATSLSTTGIDPGVTSTNATVPATNLTGGFTDFYSSWYARDLGYFEVITYHELKFIEAEAAFKAGQLDRSLAALREGIRAHMAKIGVGGSNALPAVTFPVINQGQIDAYLASPAVPQTTAQLSREYIMNQKYIAMFLNPESWSDMRRYDFAIYPNLRFPVGVNSDFRQVAGQPLKWPRRMLPGGTEVLYNPQAVAGLLSSVGAASNNDYITKPMWWDQP
jgi:hypothetical protein